jgi:hypothetical protein
MKIEKKTKVEIEFENFLAEIKKSNTEEALEKLEKEFVRSFFQKVVTVGIKNINTDTLYRIGITINPGEYHRTHQCEYIKDKLTVKGSPAKKLIDHFIKAYKKRLKEIIK